MKLLLCRKCTDIIKLTTLTKFCECGQSGGKYLDNLNAVYCGQGIPLGINNKTLITAVDNQSENGLGENFIAFVIPSICLTYKLVTRLDC